MGINYSELSNHLSANESVAGQVEQVCETWLDEVYDNLLSRFGKDGANLFMYEIGRFLVRHFEHVTKVTQDGVQAQ